MESGGDMTLSLLFTMSITPTDRNINCKPGFVLQRDEADRLRSYNQMMESHEQRMAGLTL